MMLAPTCLVGVVAALALGDDPPPPPSGGDSTAETGADPTAAEAAAKEVAIDAPTVAAEANDVARPVVESAPEPGHGVRTVADDAGSANPVADPGSDDVGGPPAAAAETEPASLPQGAQKPPAKGEARARGGVSHTPLPTAPAPEEVATITQGQWHGRGWLSVALHGSIPLGGRAPAAGAVISPVGEVLLGWRISRWLGLHTALSSYAHDAGIRTITGTDGSEIDEIVYGRITAFDLATARFYVPLRRVQPFAEAGAGVGLYRGPRSDRRAATGLTRVGMGVDWWISPSFTLGAGVGYRLTIIDKAVGHGLRAGADLSIHW